VRSETKEVFPTTEARVRVSVSNPLAQPLTANLFLDLPYPFKPVLGKQVVLGPREHTDAVFAVPVPETATGEQRITARLDTDSAALESVSRVAKLPVRQSTVVARAAGPVRIDGKLDEWGPIAEFPVFVGREEQLLKGTPYTQTYVPRIDWRGLEDLSGRARLVYDDSNLYVAVRVWDNSLGNKVYLSYPAGAYHGDCVEIFLDARGEKQGDPTFVGRAYHLKIVPPTAEHKQVFCYISKPPDGPLPGLALESQVLDDGYTLEVKVPLASLPELKVAPGLNIGFELYVSDDDEITGREQAKSALAWTGVRGGAGNPSKFGRAIFGAR